MELKEKAYKEYCRKLAEGWDPEQLHFAVINYRREVEKEYTPDRDIIPPDKFLSENHFRRYLSFSMIVRL